MNLGIKAEKAFVLWLQQQIPTATVYRGRRAQEIARPCVIVTAEDAQEAESKGGNYWYKLTITVSSEIQKADSTEADTASQSGVPKIASFEVVTDPDSGLSLLCIKWMKAGTFDIYMTMTLLYGCSAGKQTGAAGTKTDYAGHRVKTA